MELLPELSGKFLHAGEAAVLRDLVNIEIRIRQQLSASCSRTSLTKLAIFLPVCFFS